MAHRSLLSEASKTVIARELGVGDVVAREGWGAVSARQCGTIVRVALEHAQRALAENDHSLAPQRPYPASRPTRQA